MDFSLMFFSSLASESADGRYRLLIEAARFADTHGFSAIWTPERHFHPFGGLFPDPALTAAALAMVTERLQIRAGSLISPLHDTLRIAESWSVVDNLSGGRVAVSFGSGWNIDDFVFFPEVYARRHAVMYRQIEDVRTLWRGGEIRRAHSHGNEIAVRIYPPPVQPDLPVWVTTSGNVETFLKAGAIGANVLTHLIGQDLDKLAGKIACYRESLEQHGFDPQRRTVTLMLHTFLGESLDEVRQIVRQPFREYIRSAVSLEQMAALGGGVISGGHKIAPHTIPPDALEELLDLTFERYFSSASLMGTVDSCSRLVWQLAEIGVDEIACLIDFLDDSAVIARGFVSLDELRRAVSPEGRERATAAWMESLVTDLEV